MKKVSKMAAALFAAAMLLGGAAIAEDAERLEADEVAAPEAAAALDEAREGAAENAAEENSEAEPSSNDEAALDEAEPSSSEEAVSDAEADDAPYLSDADQDALLDKGADKVMESEVTQEHKKDTKSEASGKKYIVRVEVYARPETPYIPAGDLPLEEGFFSWFHDGEKQNGYAVFMYPAKSDESAIKLADDGARCIYAKSFETVEEASQEVQGPDTKFSYLITCKRVVALMLEMLQRPPYQE